MHVWCSLVKHWSLNIQALTRIALNKDYWGWCFHANTKHRHVCIKKDDWVNVCVSYKEVGTRLWSRPKKIGKEVVESVWVFTFQQLIVLGRTWRKFIRVYRLLLAMKLVTIVNVFCYWSASISLWLGVPRRQPNRRSGLATLPSVGAIPLSPHIIVD